MCDLRQDQVTSVDFIRAVGEGVSWILIIFGLPAAVFLVGEMVSRTERLRRMRLYLGAMGFVAAALPGLGTALEGFSLMANLLRIGLFIAERLSPDRARGEETERPAAG